MAIHHILDNRRGQRQTKAIPASARQRSQSCTPAFPLHLASPPGTRQRATRVSSQQALPSEDCPPPQLPLPFYHMASAAQNLRRSRAHGICVTLLLRVRLKRTASPTRMARLRKLTEQGTAMFRLQNPSRQLGSEHTSNRESRPSDSRQPRRERHDLKQRQDHNKPCTDIIRNITLPKDGIFIEGLQIPTPAPIKCQQSKPPSSATPHSPILSARWITT